MKKNFFKNQNVTSNHLRKLGKGLMGLFTIQLVLVAIILIIQSCQGNELFNKNTQKGVRNKFIKSVTTGIDKLNQIKLKSKNEFQTVSNIQKIGIIDDETAIISLYPRVGVTISEGTDFSNISNFQQIMNIDDIEVGVTYSDGQSTNNISEDQELIANYSISIEEAKEALIPTLNEVKNYLYSKGYSDTDIQNLLSADEEGPAMSESDLIPAVLSLIAEEQKIYNVSYNLPNLFFNSLYASQIGSCAGDALGISAIAMIVEGGLHTETAKYLLKKAIRRGASKALGWVGAAIFTYEFGDCMGWW